LAAPKNGMPPKFGEESKREAGKTSPLEGHHAGSSTELL
jgi:hypothetical protein